MLEEADLRISEKAYEWTSRALTALEKVLKVNIKLHGNAGQLEEGDIFVFNHFARFETLIPQYLIHRETGALSRSVATAELFRGDDALSRYLLSLGALPNDLPGLLPFLAAEVFRGRKIVVFPEGGMVKDRRVLDDAGKYSVYSRSSKERRKHHRGAAVVALAVEAFKAAVRDAAHRGERDRLRGWAEGLGFEDSGGLLAAAFRPTTVVPCNITFFPIRTAENPLHRLAELFSRNLGPRAAEELLIEGNLLLRDTDMDLRMGDSLRAADCWTWWDRQLLHRVGRRLTSLEDLFSLPSRPGGFAARWLDRTTRDRVLELRDTYMAGVYAHTTVHLSHLASLLVMKLLDRGVVDTPAGVFRRSLYLAVKNAQQEPAVHLHRSLRNPDAYEGLLEGHCLAWSQLLETASSKGLIETTEGGYRFLPKLRQEQAFDQIRLENPVTVYANEVQPLTGVTRSVDVALDEAEQVGPRRLALLRFDDQRRSHRWDWDAFHKPRHEAVNRDEQISESGEPFLLLPEGRSRRLGVLLVHGFAASPAEVRPLADRLLTLGYPCHGVRLKGHGTSPWDLLERTVEEWVTSVRIGFEILGAFADRVALVGFSAGASLALLRAAEAPARLAGVAAVCTPLLWRERAMSLVSMVHGANVLVRQFSSGQGLLPFHHNPPEHPSINYLHKPVDALYQLQRLVDEMRGQLGRVRCPVLVVQGTDDPTVDPESAELIYQDLGTAAKTLVRVPASRHGILYEDIGETHETVAEFLGRLEEQG